MKLSELDFYLQDFLLYCQSKNLSPKKRCHHMNNH